MAICASVIRGAARAVLIAGLAAWPAFAFAQSVPSLALPIDCEIGKACVVQNYLDHDPGPGARDYRCGWLSYDGHKGTDIRVIDAAALKQGVAVHAGETVIAGQKLGLVGLSGNTEFAHLHFELRHERQAVDPFASSAVGEACQSGGQPLWAQSALDALAYVETGVLDAGIAAAPPTVGDGSVDRDRTESFIFASAAAVFWVQLYGVQANDLEELRLVAPDGRVLAARRGPIARNRAQWLAYAGVRRGNTGWIAGSYRGEYALYRGAQRQRIISLVREIRLEAQLSARGGPDLRPDRPAHSVKGGA